MKEVSVVAIPFVFIFLCFNILKKNYIRKIIDLQANLKDNGIL